MKIAFVADSHVGGPGGPVEGLIQQLLDLPRQGCDQLVLLGDIFHVWVGFSQFETPEVRRFLETVKEIRAGGIRVDYVEGNRDFFLREGPYAQAFDRIVDELVLEFGDRRFLVVHGDGLNDRDYNYRFWHWFSKSAPVRWAMRNLPATWAHKLVTGTEKKLGDTNFKHKNRIPKEPILDYAQRRFQEGFQGLVLGHFHEDCSWEIEGGSVRIFEAWFRSRRIEWMDEAFS